MCTAAHVRLPADLQRLAKYPAAESAPRRDQQGILLLQRISRTCVE
jgi:hypothetical protein